MFALRKARLWDAKNHVVGYVIRASTVRAYISVTVVRCFSLLLGNLLQMCGVYRTLRSTRNAETPVKPQYSLSASDATKNVISPKRELDLPVLTSNESLSVKIETARLNGQTC